MRHIRVSPRSSHCQLPEFNSLILLQRDWYRLTRSKASFRFIFPKFSIHNARVAVLHKVGLQVTLCRTNEKEMATIRK